MQGPSGAQEQILGHTLEGQRSAGPGWVQVTPCREQHTLSSLLRLLMAVSCPWSCPPEHFSSVRAGVAPQSRGVTAAQAPQPKCPQIGQSPLPAPFQPNSMSSSLSKGVWPPWPHAVSLHGYPVSAKSAGRKTVPANSVHIACLSSAHLYLAASHSLNSRNLPEEYIRLMACIHLACRQDSPSHQPTQPLALALQSPKPYLQDVPRHRGQVHEGLLDCSRRNEALQLPGHDGVGLQPKGFLA